MKKKLMALVMAGLMLLTTAGVSVTAAAQKSSEPAAMVQVPNEEEKEINGMRATGKPVLVATYNGAYGIGIKWIQVSGASSYDIYRKYNGRWSRIKTVSPYDSSLQRSGSTLMYTDTSVRTKYGYGYIYSVAATVGGRSTGFNTTGLAAYRLKNPVFTKTSRSGNYYYVYWTSVPRHGVEVQMAKASYTSYWESFRPNSAKATAAYFTRSQLFAGAGKYVLRIRCYKTTKDRGTTYSEWSPWTSIYVY